MKYIENYKLVKFVKSGLGQHVNHSIVHESCASKDKDLNRKDLACNLCAFDVKTDAEYQLASHRLLCE